MLPKPDIAPPHLLELEAVPSVAIDVGADLGLPIDFRQLVRARREAVSVPECPVDEHRELLRNEGDVGASRHFLVVEAVAEAFGINCGRKQLAKLPLDPALRPDLRHDLAAFLRGEDVGHTRFGWLANHILFC